MADRLLYHSTLGLKVVKNRKKRREARRTLDALFARRILTGAGVTRNTGHAPSPTRGTAQSSNGSETPQTL